MDDQNKNLLIATGLSFVVILIWFLLFPPPEEQLEDQAAPNAVQAVDDTASTPSVAPGTTSDATPAPQIFT